MRSGLLVALATLVAILFGTLALTLGYAWYLRSPAYREYCADIVSEQLGLPCDIGRVIPHSRTARDFAEIAVWLPGRRAQVAACSLARLSYLTDATAPDAYEIQLQGGWAEISQRTWLRDDYRAVLESGLRPGFHPEGPQRVRFSEMDVRLDSPYLQAALLDASGEVHFPSRQEGRAIVASRRFNDFESVTPVTLRAAFSPRGAGVQLDQVEVVVPDLPLTALGLTKLTRMNLRTGSFRGALTYHETPSGKDLSASGALSGLRLEEFTAGVTPWTWHGHVPELTLVALEMRDDRLERLNFRGEFRDVAIGDVLAPWGFGDVGGLMQLQIREAEFSPLGIHRLVLSGECNAVSLESVSRALGWGRMTGTVRLDVTDLTIADNVIVSLEASITPADATASGGTVERVLLSEISRRALGFSLPSFLPGEFEYSRIGARLSVRNEVLTIFGTHGPGQRFMLSARVGGQEVPLIPEPAISFDLRPQLAVARQQLAAQLAPPYPPIGAWEPWLRWAQERWPQLWPMSPPTTQPSGAQ